MEGELTKDAGRVVSGQVLMYGGFRLERMWGDFRSRIFCLERIE